jgi:Ca-activated chloride channel family protein
MEIVLKNPFVTILFLFIPLMIVLHYYFFEHNKKRAMKFANFIAMKRVTGTHLITKNTGQLILRIAILTVLILGAINPVIWYEGKSSTTAYTILIDSSASMLSDDVLPNRLAVAKQAASVFIDNLKFETKVGLISFSGVSIIKLPLSNDPRELKDTISGINAELSGGTDIGGAMITGTNLLIPETKAKTLILITDGSDTAGSFIQESVQTALDYVVKNHIVVHTIGIGTGFGKAGYVGESDLRAVYDRNTLTQIADTTGGKYYEVTSSAGIVSAFKDIVNQSEKAQLSFDTSSLLFVIGFLLLLFEWGMLNTKFRALP